jgi:hypothetical protein
MMTQASLYEEEHLYLLLMEKKQKASSVLNWRA